MCLIWNLIKAFADTQDDNKKDNNDLEDWQKGLVKEKKYDSFNFEEEELEDDDYYPVQYLQEMIEQWEKNGRPSLLGLQQTMYYHIYANKYHIFNNQNHCAAFCTLVSKEAKLPPLNESPHFDVELWRINGGKMVSITHQPVGVKHGNGTVGGKFHNAERFKYFDEDMVMYHKLFDKEAIKYFKEIYG